MQPSTEDLLICQISALVSATAAATSDGGEPIALVEARLYQALAAHCAEKQKHAAMLAKGGVGATTTGLVYW